VKNRLKFSQTTLPITSCTSESSQRNGADCDLGQYAAQSFDCSTHSAKPNTEERFASCFGLDSGRERRIVACLTSLLEQNYPNCEILMLDDNSEDATRSCAEAIASRSSGHLRIISGATLPEGMDRKIVALSTGSTGAGGNE